ncbi:flagellar export protein FliJ [Oceanisphaera psychrotolerans]|uniref:Flagellar FliJ protein n=1 Tax=Oceanisphaera psychrotolerans TaxID=1414654 RepID=A0A1J4QC94_9GAMM|nr:flagellar export protein FliJ [Oceanisphaera psychrotolerans]OIN07711.1 flagellar export protein FliJ [Oceanisphaera psychrotolerans]
MSRALRLLLEQLETQERKAAAELNAARLQLQQFEQQQQTLSQYQRHYAQEFNNRGQQGLSAHQFGHFQGFIDKLEQTRQQQQQGLQQARQRLEQNRSAWMAVRTRKQAIDKLLEREAERQRLDSSRQEQKMLDNLAIYRFHKKSI